MDTVSDITTDPNDPRVNKPTESGQNEAYLILPQLPEEYRSKGYVRPFRDAYRHTGTRPIHPIVPLTPDEQERYRGLDYVRREVYPGDSPISGRYWTQKQLESGCGKVTTMSREIAETYARDPKFYGATFCVHCGRHLRVDEFTWWPDGSRVGS